MFLLLLASLAHATLPLPVYPSCGEPERLDLCPADMGEHWQMLSWMPLHLQDTVREAEWSQGTGLGADRAWRTTTGRTDTLVAVLDSGIQWDDTRLVRKHYLNVAELPPPQVGDIAGDTYDIDGNGVVNIDDFAADPRVAPDAGVDAADGLLDPSDLIATFSDGVDDDGNGYVDDISGWDFLWDDNDPYDDTRYGHGTGEAQDSCEEGGDGDSIGVCPNCMVLSVRTGDSYIVDGPTFTLAVAYATDQGAKVIQEALGALSNPASVQDAVDYAWDRGVIIVASAADETSWHPNYPGANAHTVFTHAIRYDADDQEDATTFLAYSNCTNHGARLDLSAPATHCSSGAVGVTAGVAGLLQSAASDAGITLTGNEGWQLMVGTADDIDVEGSDTDPLLYPSRAGWDRYFGQGRVNAWRMVEAVRDGRIPPEADLWSPGWFDVVDPTVTPTVEVRGLARASRSTLSSWVLEAAAGLDPTDDAFQEVASGTSPVDGVLATWDVTTLGIDAEAVIPPHEPGADQVDREEAVNAHTATLRLTVKDADGRTGSMRRVVYIHHDPDLLSGWPLDLGSSLEASPVLADLDDDGVMDVIQAASDGYVHALHGDGTVLPGWPVAVDLLPSMDPSSPTHHRTAPAWSVLDPDVRPAVVSSPAVGDLDGDGAPEVVVGDLIGRLYVFDAAGRVLPGFPVHQQDVSHTDPDHLLDEGFFSSPSLGDLDGDGDLEIVVGGMDQQVYAWHHDGTSAAGFPVLVRHPSFPDAGARIISSPAVGDLDGDGADDVVIGTNETLDDKSAALYAVSGDGTILPGWPVTLYCLMSDVLPYVGEGSPGSPALGDLDGDGTLEVVAHGMSGRVSVLGADGSLRLETPSTSADYGHKSNASDMLFLPLVNSPSVGDVDGDGTPDLVDGGTGFGYAQGQSDDGHRYAFDHLLGAWSGDDGDFLAGFPQQVEDLQFFMVPAIADVDGDGLVEVLTGSGGFVLHAWNADGVEPAGWPKQTGHWILGSPAVGDVDGDGALDVVVGTRVGRLYAWGTPSPAGATVEWASMRHDARNTANHATFLEGYNTGYETPGDTADGKGGCGCGTGTSSPMGPGLVLVGWILALAGRTRPRGPAFRTRPRAAR